MGYDTPMRQNVWEVIKFTKNYYVRNAAATKNDFLYCMQGTGKKSIISIKIANCRECDRNWPTPLRYLRRHRIGVSHKGNGSQPIAIKLRDLFGYPAIRPSCPVLGRSTSPGPPLTALPCSYSCRGPGRQSRRHRRLQGRSPHPIAGRLCQAGRAVRPASVSFVSVTQSFNTTTSMGRLTLNVLLSFAQFEREVIGERVRDKIAASKSKGIWVGGSIPLGYASVNKKLVVIPHEAETVRKIFRRYLSWDPSVTSSRTWIEREFVRGG